MISTASGAAQDAGPLVGYGAALVQNRDAEHDQHLRTPLHPPIRSRTLQRQRRSRRICEGRDHPEGSKISSGDVATIPWVGTSDCDGPKSFRTHPFNRVGKEMLFVEPNGDSFAERHDAKHLRPCQEPDAAKITDLVFSMAEPRDDRVGTLRVLLDQRLAHRRMKLV